MQEIATFLGECAKEYVLFMGQCAIFLVVILVIVVPVLHILNKDKQAELIGFNLGKMWVQAVYVAFPFIVVMRLINIFT